MQEAAPADGTEAFKMLKAAFDKLTKQLKKQAEAAGKQLSNVFIFCEEVFEEGQEMLILVTELTVNSAGSRFLASFGSADYQRHNQELMLSERQDDIKKKIGELGL